MTIWNVKATYDGDKIRYIVLPYDLIETIKSIFKTPNKYKIKFLINCRFSEKSARKYANYKANQHDIEY